MIFDIIIRQFKQRLMRKKLTYKEIIDYTHTCKIELGRDYKYKDTIYQVCDISLQAGVDKPIWQVIYYPVDKILVRFSRELEDFKSKFEKI